MKKPTKEVISSPSRKGKKPTDETDTSETESSTLPVAAKKPRKEVISSPPRKGKDSTPAAKRAVPAGTLHVKHCKNCGKARGPTDRFRKEGGVGVLLCPDCFAKTQ